jgi:hypothetical protein
MEWWVCKYSGVYYKEQDFFDAVGYGVWAEQVFIDFVCKPTLFANDKIRICYYTPMEDGLPEAKTRFVNTNPDDAK